MSATRIRADVEFLADDLLEGREAATRGYDLAARYVATALKAAGYAPGADDGTYFQQVPFIESTPTATSMRLTISGATTDVPLPDEGMVGASAVAADRGGDRAGRVRRLRGHGARVRARRLRRPRRHGQDCRAAVQRAQQAAERAARALRLDRSQAEKRRRPRRRCRRHGARARRREALPLGTGEGVLRQADADVGERGRHAGPDREAPEGSGLPQPTGLSAPV